MVTLLELEAGPARLDLAPDMGAGIANLFLRPGKGRETPVLRPWQGPESGPFGLAMNLLAPFSNRISGGGFTGADGRFHAVRPNLSGEELPIHGDAFQREWTVRAKGRDHALLALPQGEIGPFRYRAEARYHLTASMLRIGLDLVNEGRPLPFGGGFHPWFPRAPRTKLSFAARKVWLEDARHLPTEEIPASGDWNHAEARPLPAGFVNNAFTGWDGRASILQPDRGLQITISTAPPLDVAILFSPGAEADFFCFEPVSHAVDAHNRPGHPGLQVLHPGESLSLSMSLGW